ncbi:hypothetical protein NK718_20700 [Alsobacter sp. SYSU M60028]|uniref:Uncharacterized protein n=1 Tax=Alsobacter ponti TaxID=2962936 RepID=A0ABT1LL24_9HYPH|nr:hypothetical protein [Alsobacter ponti]MCP8940953.1 hypothetical protein [Alsobacter ponti]
MPEPVSTPRRASRPSAARALALGWAVACATSGAALAAGPRAWTCQVSSQHGFEVAAIGDGELSVRGGVTPLSIRMQDELSARELDLTFADPAYQAAFGRRFTSGDSVISHVRDVVRVASTSGSSGLRSLALERDRDAWRFVLTASGFAARPDPARPKPVSGARAPARTVVVTGLCEETAAPARLPRPEEAKASAPFDLLLSATRIADARSLLSPQKPEAAAAMLVGRPLVERSAQPLLPAGEGVFRPAARRPPAIAAP